MQTKELNNGRCAVAFPLLSLAHPLANYLSPCTVGPQVARDIAGCVQAGYDRHRWDGGAGGRHRPEAFLDHRWDLTGREPIPTTWVIKHHACFLRAWRLY